MKTKILIILMASLVLLSVHCSSKDSKVQVNNDPSGSNSGTGIRPIAHTDVVPYQRIEYGTTFNFGVVAFSKPGINRVEFTISGQSYSGGVKTSTEMTLNTRVASARYAGVWEYWVPISASEFTGNGEITVTPTVYDNDGNTRILAPTTLIAEGAGISTPHYAYVNPLTGDNATASADSTDRFQTIQAAVTAAQTANGGDSSGNIIYLDEYDGYSVGGLSFSVSGEWLTITKTPSADKEDVIITTGVGQSGIKYDSITFEAQGEGWEYWIINARGSLGFRGWTKSCRHIGYLKAAASGVSYPVQTTYNLDEDTEGYFYSTDDYFTNMADTGVGNGNLVRGAWMEDLGGDAFKQFHCIINGYVDGISENAVVHTYHMDVLQTWQRNSSEETVTNRLAYNVYAKDCHYQGIFRSWTCESGCIPPHDNAFVNVFIEMREPGEPAEYCNRHTNPLTSVHQEDHLIMWHCSFPYSGAGSCGSLQTNSSIIGNLYWAMIENDLCTPDSTSDWLYNHFMNVAGGEACTPTGGMLDQADPLICDNWDGWAICPNAIYRYHDTGEGTYSSGQNVVDISDDTDPNFGYPVIDSVLIDRIPEDLPGISDVKCDVFGNPRDTSPDIGAIEVQ